MSAFLSCSWHIFRAGWRPAAGWVSVLILGVNGAILPIARLFGSNLEPLNWHEMTAFVSTLLGLGALRTWEKHVGKDQ